MFLIKEAVRLAGDGMTAGLVPLGELIDEQWAIRLQLQGLAPKHPFTEKEEGT